MIHDGIIISIFYIIQEERISADLDEKLLDINQRREERAVAAAAEAQAVPDEAINLVVHESGGVAGEDSLEE